MKSSIDQKRLICALHFLSVDLSNPKVQELLSSFIHDELEGKTFKIGKELIVDDGEFTQSFSRVFNSFDDESVVGYYSIMNDIRSSIIDLVTDDVSKHYKLTFSESTRPLLKDTISKLIRFNLSNPKKINSNPTWFNMPNQLSFELYDVLDITSKVKMIKDGEFTKAEYALKPEVINTINSHICNIKRIPKLFEQRYMDIITKTQSLRLRVNNKRIYFVDPIIDYVAINGVKHYKCDLGQAINAIREDTDIIVVANLNLFNSKTTSEYDYYIVKVNGELNTYCKETGQMTKRGYIHAD